MEPANFPEIYTGNEDESDRMQDIAGCFDPIIPRNDGFQYDIEVLLPMFVTAKINGNYLSCRLPRER